MKLYIALNKKKSARMHVQDFLAKLLANEIELYTRIRKYQWTKKDPDEHHILLDQQLRELELTIDAITECMIKTAGKATHTAKPLHAHISKHPYRYDGYLGMWRDLLADHEALIIDLQKASSIYTKADNRGNLTDLLTKLLNSHLNNTATIREELQTKDTRPLKDPAKVSWAFSLL
jgi:DNA-binding ferritin-like protein